MSDVAALEVTAADLAPEIASCSKDMNVMAGLPEPAGERLGLCRVIFQ